MFLIALLLALVGAAGIMRRAASDPAMRGLSIIVAVVLTIGTFFYWSVEGWSILDSLYFTVVALTTVGFGDLAPETAAGKAFTIVYLLTGVGLLMGFATAIVQRSRLWARIEERAAKDKAEADETEASSPSAPGRRASYRGDGEP